MTSLFKSVKADVKRKRVFLLSADLCEQLDSIEKRVEKHGISFPINEHVVAAIKRLTSQAEKELSEMENHNNGVNKADDAEFTEG